MKILDPKLSHEYRSRQGELREGKAPKDSQVSITLRGLKTSFQLDLVFYTNTDSLSYGFEVSERCSAEAITSKACKWPFPATRCNALLLV